MCSYAELSSTGKERIDATLRVDKNAPSILLKSMIQNANRRSAAVNLVKWNIVTDEEPARQRPLPVALSKSIEVVKNPRKSSVRRPSSKSIALVRTNDSTENVMLQMVPAPSSPSSFKLSQRLRSGNSVGEESMPMLRDKKLKQREPSFSKDLKLPRSHTNSEFDGFFFGTSSSSAKSKSGQNRLSRKSSGKDLAKLDHSLSNLSNPVNKLFKRDNSSSQPSMVPFASESSKLNARSIELVNLKQEQRRQVS